MRPTARKQREQELAALAADAADCRDCELWKRGTQTVFGDGDANAALMLVGEQPGNDEDLAGKPFVGPAGRLLRRAFDDAGIDVDHLYLTNAVKHFKWVAKGKKRIHDRPSGKEVLACKPWLEAELAAVNPRLVVALGAVAASSFFGREFRVLANRGDTLNAAHGWPVFITVHPSSILRSRDAEERAAAFSQFVDDLKQAKSLSERPLEHARRARAS